MKGIFSKTFSLSCIDGMESFLLLSSYLSILHIGEEFGEKKEMAGCRGR